MPNPVNPGNQAGLPLREEVINMNTPDNFHEFRSRVADRIQNDKSSNLKDEVVQLGNLMTERGVSPQNREERLMKEIWDISTPQEKQTLAGLMVRLTEQKMF